MDKYFEKWALENEQLIRENPMAACLGAWQASRGLYGNQTEIFREKLENAACVLNSLRANIEGTIYPNCGMAPGI